MFPRNYIFFNLIFFSFFLTVRKAKFRIAEQYQGTQCGGALQTTTRRRTGGKTRRYRELQSATTKNTYFPHLQRSQAKYHETKFGGAKPDDLHDPLSFSTKEHFQAFTILPYAK